MCAIGSLRNRCIRLTPIPSLYHTHRLDFPMILFFTLFRVIFLSIDGKQVKEITTSKSLLAYIVEYENMSIRMVQKKFFLDASVQFNFIHSTVKIMVKKVLDHVNDSRMFNYYIFNSQVTFAVLKIHPRNFTFMSRGILIAVHA